MALTVNPGVKQTLTEFTAPISGNRFVKADGTLCGAGEKPLGISMHDVDAESKTLGLCLTGIWTVVAGGTCTKNNECESDANGKAVNLSTGKSCGVLMDSGSTGQEVRVCIR